MIKLTEAVGFLRVLGLGGLGVIIKLTEAVGFALLGFWVWGT